MSYAFCKWSTIFKCNFSIFATISYCYVSCYKNICIWIIAKIWFNGFGFKFYGCTTFISFTIVCIILIIDNITNFLLQILKIHCQYHPINFQFFKFPLLYVVKIKQLLQHFVKIQKLFLLTCRWWKTMLLLHFFFKSSNEINLLF